MPDPMFVLSGRLDGRIKIEFLNGEHAGFYRGVFRVFTPELT